VYWIVTPNLVFSHAAEIIAGIQNLDVFTAQRPQMLFHSPFIPVQLFLHDLLKAPVMPVGDVGQIRTAVLEQVARHWGDSKAFFLSYRI
jgi:hypothetical protein